MVLPEGPVDRSEQIELGESSDDIQTNGIQRSTRIDSVLEQKQRTDEPDIRKAIADLCGRG